MGYIVSRGPFALIGGAVETRPDFRRYARHQAQLRLVDRERPRLGVRPGITQEELELVERWALLRVREAAAGAYGEEWTVAVRGDGRLSAEVWLVPRRKVAKNS